VTWSPNKLWRFNSIFNLCEHRNDGECFRTTPRAVSAIAGVPAFPNIPVVPGNPAFAVAKSQQQQRVNKARIPTPTETPAIAGTPNTLGKSVAEGPSTAAESAARKLFLFLRDVWIQTQSKQAGALPT
jgi:hypothetical protein